MAFPEHTCSLGFLSRLAVLLSVSISGAAKAEEHPPPLQPRAPHGVAFERPLSLSPSALEFFHPNSHPLHPPLPAPTTIFPAAASSNSMARADRVTESAWPFARPSSGRTGPAGVVVISLTAIGVVFVAIAAMGASLYFFAIQCRTSSNTKRPNNVIQPDP